MTVFLRAAVKATVLLAVLALGAAAAEPERPWARGVPPDKQRVALELFRDGNAALKDSLFVKAVAKYREALASWDHPAIHYNLALALVNLDQPVETHEHLLAAMKYGPAPLDSDKYEQAIRYKSLVEKQLATVKITCVLGGAQVVMDGRPLFTAPGQFEGVVRSGPHSIVASREGYLTNNLSRSLAAGETTTIDLKLYTAADLTEYRRLWPVYVPWLVVGLGAVVAGGGAILHASSSGAFKAFDQGINACVAQDTGGCRPSVALLARKQTGDTLQALGITSYFVGGAALITGAVLVYLNRLQPFEVAAPSSGKPEVTLVPVLTPGGAGAAAFVRF